MVLAFLVSLKYLRPFPSSKKTHFQSEAKCEAIDMKMSFNYDANKTHFHNKGALSIQPKIPEISVGSSDGTDHFGLVRPEYSGPALKVVHSDRSGHFGRSDRNVPFHLPKLLSPVPLFSILLTEEQVVSIGKSSTVSKAMTSQTV